MQSTLQSTKQHNTILQQRTHSDKLRTWWDHFRFPCSCTRHLHRIDGGLVKKALNPMSLDTARHGTARHSLQKGIGNVQTPSCHAVWNARALNARKVYLHNVVQKTADWRAKATQYTYASDNRKIDRICFRCTVYPLCGWYRRFSAKCVHVRTSERALAIE